LLTFFVAYLFYFDQLVAVMRLRLHLHFLFSSLYL